MAPYRMPKHIGPDWRSATIVLTVDQGMVG
ncbi:hypothetical protein HPGCJGGD_3771 [Methylobacterium haplocladii]|nr:hypothetical protein HPGCJGGD_3771 [Methylobacterium haplocladii]